MSRDAMLRCMADRAVAIVPDGEPIIPDGPVATTEDMQDFKRVVQVLGYGVRFGKASAVTRPGERMVHLTARCAVGVLTDEFLHVWNNFADNRGRNLEDQAAAEHRALASTYRLSGSSNDRRFHQLELQNYTAFLTRTGGAIPLFVWRTFSMVLRRTKAAGAT